MKKGKVSFAHRYFSSDYELACASVERLTQYDVKTIAFAHYPLDRYANGVLARPPNGHARWRPARRSVTGRPVVASPPSIR